MLRQTHRPAWLLFLSVWWTSAYFFHPEPGWNVNSRLNLTYAIVDFGSFEITPYLTDRAYFTQDVAYFNGRYYSDKIIGVSLLGVPAYWGLRLVCDALDITPSPAVRRYVTRTFSVSVCAALAVVVMFFVLQRLGIEERPAFFTSLLVHFGTLLFPYSTLYYPYSAATLFALLSFYQMLRLVAVEQPGAAGVFLSGLAMGASLLCEYIYIWIFLALWMYLAARTWHRLGRRRALLLLYPLGAGLPLLVFAAYLISIFGTIVLPYQFETHPSFEGMKENLGFGRPRLSVLYFITVHPYRGVLIQSPFLIAAGLGVARAFRRTSPWRHEAALSLALIVIYLLFNSSYYMWWGGWAMGPRHLIPMLPFWGLWFAAAWRQSGGVERWLWGGLAALSVIMVGVPAMIDPQIPQGYVPEILHEARIGKNLKNPAYYAAFPAFMRGALAPNFLTFIWPEAGLAALVPLAAVWGGVAWLGGRWIGGRGSGTEAGKGDGMDK
ncbi:MAG: hypothetical protein Kow0059_22160 [Candidatus Sumerlaeia bacterium]